MTGMRMQHACLLLYHVYIILLCYICRAGGCALGMMMRCPFSSSSLRRHVRRLDSRTTVSLSDC